MPPGVTIRNTAGAYGPPPVWGKPGTTWSNDTGAIWYQFHVAGANTCGFCYQYDGAVRRGSWPIELHRGCCLPGTKILAPGIRAGLCAPYSGDVCRITLADGTAFAVTPNHMLLTPTGFAPASALMEGDDVIRSLIGQGELGSGPDQDRNPTPIEEMIDSLKVAGGMVSRSVPVSPEDLHGDARFCDGEIDVVAPDGFLWDDIDSAGFEHASEDKLALAGLRPIPLAGQGDLMSLLLGVRDATDGGVGSLRERKALLWRRSPGPIESGGRPIANLDIGSDEQCPDPVAGDAERIRECQLRFPGKVTTAKVVGIDCFHYSGPVYDVQTASTLYIIESGVVSSNCNCRQTPVMPGESAPEPFTDFRAKVDALDEHQRAEVVGVGNYRLIKAGLVAWEDVVSPYRVRDLREVVAVRKLTEAQMIKAGVAPAVARQAYAAVHTPAHQLAEQQRQQLIANLKGAGLAPSQITALAARGIARRVVIASGPSGPSKRPGGSGIDLKLLRSFLAGSAAQQRAAMKPPKLKPAGPQPEPLKPVQEPPAPPPAEDDEEGDPSP